MWNEFKNPEATFKGTINMDSAVIRCLNKVVRIGLHKLSRNIVLLNCHYPDPIKPIETSGNSDQTANFRPPEAKSVCEHWTIFSLDGISD